MKKTIKKTASVLCAGIIFFTSVTNVFAKDNKAEDDIILPSGITLTQYNEEMKKLSDTGKYSSALVGLFKGEDVLYTGYFGSSNEEENIQADENSVYEWGSISKTLIWVSAMQLWEQGKLDLEKDVRDYLPDGFFQHLSYDDPITMMNLMNHNAGFQETSKTIVKKNKESIKSLKEELKAIEPAQPYRPGEVTAYSNYGAAVAGYVIECVSGEDYCSYVRKHIFEPLGMKHTSLNPTHSDNEFVYNRRPQMHSYMSILGIKSNLGSALEYIPCYPAGAATGTLADMITYGQALVNSEAPLFNDPKTQDKMFEGTDFYGKSDIPICAHGFWCTEYSITAYGHSGSTEFGQADLEFDRDTGFGTAVMINETGENCFIGKVSLLAFGAPDENKYEKSSEVKKMDGFYIPARSNTVGMFKYISFLSAVSGREIGEAQSVGDGVYRSELGLSGEKQYSDGRTGLQVQSADMIKDTLYIPKLVLFSLYILMAFAGIFQLLVRRLMKKHGRFADYKGSKAVFFGILSWIVSVLMMFTVYLIYSVNMGGVPFAESAVIGIIQIVCMAAGACSAVICLAELIKQKTNRRKYALCTTGSVIMLTASVCFELYRFWGI